MGEYIDYVNAPRDQYKMMASDTVQIIDGIASHTKAATVGLGDFNARLAEMDGSKDAWSAVNAAFGDTPGLLYGIGRSMGTLSDDEIAALTNLNEF